jgi:hypothetical protein
MRSTMEIGLRNDLIANYQLQLAMEEAATDQKLATYKIHKTVDWDGLKVLFVSFEIDGVTKHDTAHLAKDAATGYWIPGDGIAASRTFSKISEQLDGRPVRRDPIEEMAREWRERGSN